MDVVTQHGYLVLADISGYTSYLAATELDHAHEILTDLLETIVGRFKVLLTIVKLEGDAVFAYAPESKLPRGETLLELIEATYAAFRDRREAAHRRTTCTCNACRHIPTLDLKFLTHHGDYIVQDVSGIKELVGSDVNLIHRLLKNHVAEATGWRAYALFTESSLNHLRLTMADLHLLTETYEHLGAVKTLSFDLHPRYQQMVEARRAFVTPAEAHVVMDYDYAASPLTLWDWFNDPRKRGRWMHSEIVPMLRVGGRNTVGARNHCVHGKNEIVVEDVLDFRPFEYYTVAHTPKGTPATILMTFQFTPIPTGGTRVRMTFKGRLGRLPDWAGRWMCEWAVRTQLRPRWAYNTIDALIAADPQSAPDSAVVQPHPLC